jgi:molybdate transport system regulatory protein
MAKTKKHLEVTGTVSFKKKDLEFLGSDRMTGGKSGGGTRLTEAGKELIRKYRIINEEHAKFLTGLEDKMEDASTLYKFLKRISMKVSARNIFAGTVEKIAKGAVNSEVDLLLKGGNRIIAIITNESVESLGLKQGTDAYAIIKASSVIIGDETGDLKVSARNKLHGQIAKLTKGAVNTELNVEFSGGNTINAIITNESVEELGLAEGRKVCAMFKASSVIMGVG